MQPGLLIVVCHQLAICLLAICLKFVRLHDLCRGQNLAVLLFTAIVSSMAVLFAILVVDSRECRRNDACSMVFYGTHLALNAVARVAFGGALTLRAYAMMA